MASTLDPRSRVDALKTVVSVGQPSAPTQPSPNVVDRRIFVGPMPERVIAHTEGHGKKGKLTIGSVLSIGLEPEESGEAPDRSEEISQVLKEHAFKYFIHHGGREEDWDPEEEHTVVEDLTKAWKDSEWGQMWSARHHRRKNDPRYAGNNRWFGKSFEIGNLLGVNILQQDGHLVGQDFQTGQDVVSSSKDSATNPDLNPVAETTDPTIPPSLQETFATPRVSVTDDDAVSSAKIDFQPHPGLALSRSLRDEDVSSTPTSSRTGLLLKSRTETNHNQATTSALSPPQQVVRESTSTSALKGKAKMVRYDDSAISLASGHRTQHAVPPEMVLQRTKDSVDPNTSLAASVPDPDDLKWGDVVLRDRMLVRASYTELEGITKFDEATNRTTRDLHFEGWGEFMVVWRRDNLEVYRDYGMPGKEWASGHKHLSFVIPLKSSKTRLTLYSFTDLTFSITCTPTATRLTPTSHWIFSREKEGTNIFIFKLKSRSRAYDWIWHLWRHMGGQIPTTIDIHNPRLNTKVTIDVPKDVGVDTTAFYEIFRRDNIVRLCMALLRTVPDWKYLIEGDIMKGKSLQLAWRRDANLDWVWLEKDVLGKPRDWAVLCGLPFKQASRPPVLEIRLANHSLTHIHLTNGRHLDEPPALEGYLDRVRPNTQTKQQVYISIHNGNLFILNTNSAFPPMPPGLTPISNVYEYSQSLRHTEIRRGINQILTATGVCDLRTILVIRRASHPTSAHMHTEKERNVEDSSWFNTWNTSEELTQMDEGDEGGEEGLSKGHDRTHLKVRRSFELLLTTGHIVRFEAYSCKVAIEWVERLRALVFYWKIRHRNDAKQEIELAQSQRPRLTPQTRACHDDHEIPPETPADPSSPYGAIDNLFNWCILEGCKPIMKGGRLYMKKGLHGQYKLIQLFLVAGHLVCFRIGSQSSLYRTMGKNINLLDAYVCSGYFAAQALPSGQYTPNTNPAPRRYQDGLETDDREEDMMFMIWYRSHPPMTAAEEDPTTTPRQVKSIPRLSSKNKMLVFKTRSLYERDSWCWALNVEIEKIVRAQTDREDRLRASGNLVKLGI